MTGEGGASSTYSDMGYTQLTTITFCNKGTTLYYF